jgi:GDPmannose 4,6-dehydratase
MKGIVRRALIFGVSGQDGALLAHHLGAHGYEVHGTSRRPDA